MTRTTPLRIGNASGYWGDDPRALYRQVNGGRLVHSLAHERGHRVQTCADESACHGRPNAERRWDWDWDWVSVDADRAQETDPFPTGAPTIVRRPPIGQDRDQAHDPHR